MLRQTEKLAEEDFTWFLRFMRTTRGWIWVALAIIAAFLIAEPDDGEVTVHTQFLLVCFACLAMAPDFSSESD
jgi:hypothetical protein